MAKIERKFVIEAPVEAVCDYLEDPTHLPVVWPSFLEVKDVRPSPLGGNNFRFVYKLLGLRFEGSNEIVEFVRHQRAVTRTKGGLEGTNTWEFRSVNGGTEITLTMESKLPASLLSKFAEPFVVKASENDIDVFTANVKAILETHATPIR
jgi:carbon monoxide dehydrogenase subunit G